MDKVMAVDLASMFIFKKNPEEKKADDKTIPEDKN